MGSSSSSNPATRNIRWANRFGIKQSLDVSSLPINTTLKHDIFDKRGILLLAAGSFITARFLAKLKRRRITAVTVRPSPNTPAPSKTDATSNPPEPDPSRPIETETTKTFDAMAENTLFGRLPIPVSCSKPASRLELNQLREEVKAGLKCVEAIAQHYEIQVGKISRGERTDLSHIETFVQLFADLVARDKSLGPMIADFQSDTYQYVSKQAIKTAVLSVAIANHLSLQASLVNDIGVAALIQDLGMMRVPESIRFAARKLTKGEMVHIKHHPIYSLDMLERSASIGNSVQIIVYQAHERCDGSGYPRGRSGRFIHPLAKLLAVADTYSAMTTAKPQRKAMSPYAAVKEVLIEAHKHRLDRGMVRTFLDFLSVFPIGSRVMLSDGSIAKILRSNGSLHTKPVVLRLNDDQTESNTELDLSNIDSPHITQYLEDTVDDQGTAIT